MTKPFRTLCAAMVLSFLCAAPAIAAPITLNITWSGQSFQNNASATGVIKLEDFLLVANGGISTEAFAISAIEVAVDDGMGGMTYFNRTDFFTLQFQDVDQLDVRREWIGQTLANAACLAPRAAIAATVKAATSICSAFRPARAEAGSSK